MKILRKYIVDSNILIHPCF